MSVGIPTPPTPDAPPAVPRSSFRSQLAIAVTAAVSIPLLAATITGTWLFSRREDAGSDRGIRNAALTLSRDVESNLAEHRRAVAAAARAIEDVGRLDGPGAVATLVRTRSVYPGFLTMLVANDTGLVVTSEPQHDSLGRSVASLRLRVNDRRYFVEAMRTGQPYVSDAFLGRGIGRDPIVAVSAPVRGRNGRTIGIVEGSLDLPRLELLSQMAMPTDVGIIILDGRNVVVQATPTTGYRTLDSIGGDGLERTLPRTGEGSFRYVPSGEDQTYLAAVSRIGTSGWRLIVRQRAAEVRGVTRRFMWIDLLLLLLGLAGGVTAAAIISRNATQPIEQLEVAVRGFLDGTPSEPVVVDAGTPREVADLVQGFDEMSRRVGKSLSGLLPVCAWCKRIHGEGSGWVSLEAYVHDHTAAEVTHGICPDCLNRL